MCVAIVHTHYNSKGLKYYIAYFYLRAYIYLLQSVVNKVCDQIVSFIQEERTPIYTFQFARHFAHATALLVRSREIRTNEVQ
jgi:hypothetical protein